VLVELVSRRGALEILWFVCWAQVSSSILRRLGGRIEIISV